MTYGQRLAVLNQIDRICLNARIFLDLIEEHTNDDFEEVYRSCYREEAAKLLFTAKGVLDDAKQKEDAEC